MRPLTLFLSLIALCSGVAEASPPPVAFDPSLINGSVDLTPYLEIIEDPNSEKPIEQLNWDDSIAGGNQVPTYGYTSSTFWIRIKLQTEARQTPANTHWILELASPGIDSVTVFESNSSENFKTLYQTGDRLPFKSRTIHSPSFLFPVRTSNQPSQNLLIRIQSTSSVAIPLRAWTPEALAGAIGIDGIILGLFYGAMVIILVINVLFGLTTKNPTFLAYAAFLLPNILFQSAVDSTGFRYIWGNFPEWNSVSAFTLGCFTLSAGSYYFKKFIGPHVASRAINSGYIYLSLGFFLTALTQFVLPYKTSVTIATLLVIPWIVMGLSGGIIATRKGFEPARIYLFGWLMLFLGVLIYIGRMFNLIEWSLFTNQAIKIGTLLESLAFYLALTIGYRREIREKSAAKMRAHTLQKQAEFSKRSLETAQQVAHDVRAPIAALKSLLNSGIISDSSESKEDENILRFSIMRIEQIANDLLKRETSTSDQKDHLTPQDLIRIIREISREVSQPFKMTIECEIKLDVSTSRNSRSLDIHVSEFSRVLSNLLINAAEAKPNDACVKCRIFESEGSLKLQIEDNGPGFSAEVLSSFGTRGLTIGKPNGNGIGLSSAVAHVDRHGGSFSIENIKPQGARVILTYPFSKSDSPSLQVRDPQAQ